MLFYFKYIVYYWLYIVNKVNKMDSDSTKEIQTTEESGEPPSILQRNIANVSNVFSAFWLRCPFQIDNGSKRIVLDSRYRILFYLGIIFYIILFIESQRA
jgi:hypothetical protein